MKSIILLLMFISSILACSGNCLACHEKLKKTIQTDLLHKPMLECISCHEEDTSNMGECGGDCFDCHSPAKIMDNNIQSHKVITNCMECHTNIKGEPLISPQYNQSIPSFFK